MAIVLALFVYPLLYSLLSAFTTANGAFGFDNFAKTFELYGTDILFTIVIVAVSTVLTGILAALIGGYLVLGTQPAAVAVLNGSTVGPCSSRSSLRRSACAPFSQRTAC